MRRLPGSCRRPQKRGPPSGWLPHPELSGCNRSWAAQPMGQTARTSCCQARLSLAGLLLSCACHTHKQPLLPCVHRSACSILRTRFDVGSYHAGSCRCYPYTKSKVISGRFRTQRHGPYLCCTWFLQSAGCWRLYGGAWQFLTVLQRAADGLASLSPPTTPRLSPQHQEAPLAPPSSEWLLLNVGHGALQTVCTMLCYD